MVDKLNASQIRKSNSRTIKKHLPKLFRQDIVLVLDNILDTYNIGSFFRLADAISAKQLFLCGPVCTPPNIKIHRASIGTWKWVKWQHCQNTLDCVKQLKNEGYCLVSCELSHKSIPYKNIKYKTPLAIIAGSESLGISKDVLKISDIVAEIPMYGINKSLNTLTAASIIAYEAVSCINMTKR